MLRYLPENALVSILSIYNQIWNGHMEIPTKWKQIRVIGILKPDKDKNLETSYRPISLIPCMIKILNVMIKNRLQWFTEKHNLIPNTQYGFRQRRGVNDYMLTLIADINIALTYNETTIAASLDLSNAYDNVSIPILCDKMTDIGFPPKFISYCQRWLIDRQITIQFPNFSYTRHAFKGLPQGSVLSPLLFSLYIAHINNCHDISVKSIQYADDILLYASGKHEINVQERIQTALNRTEHSFQKLQLDFNSSKCKAIIFTRKKRTQFLNISINGQLIPSVDNMKVLGVTFDKKLKFKMHINNIYVSCLRHIDVLKSMCCGKNGINPEFAIQLYKSLIQSRLDYCCFLIDNCAQQDLKKLNMVQNVALRVALGLLKSTPIIAMQAECSILPLDVRRSLLTNRLIYKVMSESNHPSCYKIMQLKLLTETMPYWQKKNKPLYIKALDNISQYNPIFNLANESTTIYEFEKPLFMHDLKIACEDKLDVSKKCNEVLLQQYFYDRMNITYKDYTCIFTDGSKTSEGTGAAFYIPAIEHKELFKLNKFISSYTAELYAILKATEFIKQLNLNNKYVICTDSQAAIKTIEMAKVGRMISGIALNILLQCVSTYNEYVIQWTPGHSGIVQNDIVDSLAKRAIRDGIHMSDLLIPIEDFKCIDRKSNKEVFIRQFQITTAGKWYKQVVPTPPLVPWFKKLELKRKEIIDISRLRIGHAKCNSKFFSMKMMFTPICLNCTTGQEETLDHLILLCPKNDFARVQHFKLIKQKFKDKQFNLIDILKTNDIGIYREIIRYIASTQIQL